MALKPKQIILPKIPLTMRDAYPEIYEQFRALNKQLDKMYIDIFISMYDRWDDMRCAATAVRLSGSKPPSWTSYKGGSVLAFGDEAVNEEIIYYIAQLTHKYKEGSNLLAHVHWVPEDNAGGNVRWEIQHSWANMEAAFPGATTIVADCAAGTTTDKHIRSDIDSLDGEGKKISSMVFGSLTRKSGHANDTYTGKSAYFLELDFHLEVDGIGSGGKLTK